jgi:hypothetical protein
MHPCSWCGESCDCTEANPVDGGCIHCCGDDQEHRSLLRSDGWYGPLPSESTPHDRECETELTSHGYTHCRCHERAGICYCRKNPCVCLPDIPENRGGRMTCIMDFPTAWAYIREQHPNPAEHDPRCSWVQTQGGILCDCHVINDEYERRKAAVATDIRQGLRRWVQSNKYGRAKDAKAEGR